MVGIAGRDYFLDGLLRGEVGIGDQVGNAFFAGLKATLPGAELLAASAGGGFAGFQKVVGGSSVTIAGTRRQICLPVKSLTGRLNREFVCCDCRMRTQRFRVKSSANFSRRRASFL